jgi:putative hemolysin
MANVRKPIVNDVAVGGNRVAINDPVGVGSQQCSWTTDKSLASVIVQSIGNYGTSYASVADGSFHVALSYSNAGGVGLIQDVKGNFNAKKTVGASVVVKGLSVKCSRESGCSRTSLIPKSLQDVSGVYRVSYVQNSFSLTRGNGEASVPHLVFGAIDIILPKPTVIVTDDPAIAHCEQQKGSVIEKSDKTLHCALPLGTVCELHDFYKRVCPTVPTPVVTVPAPPVADLAYTHCILNKGEVIAGVSDNVRVRYCKLPNGVKCELSQYYNNVCPSVVVAPTALPPDSNISTAIRYCNSNRGTVVRVKEASSTAYKYVCKTASKTTCELWDFYYGVCR